jgi:hypothetical protein
MIDISYILEDVLECMHALYAGLFCPKQASVLPEVCLKLLGTLGTKLGTIHSFYDPMQGNIFNHYVLVLAWV